MKTLTASPRTRFAAPSAPSILAGPLYRRTQFLVPAVVIFAGVVMFTAGPSARAANQEIDVINGQTDLTVMTTYTQNVAPTTAKDVTFTNVTYAPTTFTVGAAMTAFSLNDLDTTQALTITDNTANGW